MPPKTLQDRVLSEDLSVVWDALGFLCLGASAVQGRETSRLRLRHLQDLLRLQLGGFDGFEVLTESSAPGIVDLPT